MNNFKPMLSATLVDFKSLRFPLLVSPKLDGLRCIIKGGVALSRNLKPFRNSYVQERLKGLPDGLDGELIVGAPNEGLVLNRTQSGIMSTEGEPDFTFWVFDNFAMRQGFNHRYNSLREIDHPHIVPVPHDMVESVEAFEQKQLVYLSHGYEGIMARDAYGEYKFGRSTLNEGGLIKYKQFTDGEARVVDLLEGVHNMNELETDNLGRSKRSHHQANMIGSKRVGTIMATDLVTGAMTTISPGRMTQDMRIHYWLHQDQLLGKIVKYKCFDYGKKDNVRFPTFQIIRDEADMSPPFDLQTHMDAHPYGVGEPG